MQKHPGSASRKFQKIGGNSSIQVRAFDFAPLQKFRPENLLAEGFKLSACLTHPTSQRLTPHITDSPDLINTHPTSPNL
jgi:hypothetical protein